MKRFIVASRNQGKLKEIREILGDLPYEVIPMEEAGFTQDIDETGKTFEENALIKAQAIFDIQGGMVMADDSGLEVDYLDGAPGVYSARFAGEGASDRERNNKLLKLLEGVPLEKRKARFVCAVAVIFPDERNFTVRGTCEGYIGSEPAGDYGFGYDPLFFMPEYNRTIAQMEPSEKNGISHRGRALRRMVEELKKMAAEC